MAEFPCCGAANMESSLRMPPDTDEAINRGFATMTARSTAVPMAEISGPPALAGHARDMATQSAEALAAAQKSDGHFVFELEADATIPAEYIFLNRFLGESEPEREAELAEHIRSVP